MLLGLSEPHWDTIGEFTSSEGNFVFSSAKGGHTAVAEIVDKRYKNLVIGTRAKNDRVTVVRMDAALHTISITQAYAPFSVASEEETDEFYNGADRLIAADEEDMAELIECSQRET